MLLKLDWKSHNICLDVSLSSYLITDFISADHIYKCWQPPCSRTETIDFSSSGCDLSIPYLVGLTCTITWYVLSFSILTNQIYSLYQVVALCQAPFLLDDPNVGLLFPADAIARAKHYLSLTTGGLGATLVVLLQDLWNHNFTSRPSIVNHILTFCPCISPFHS